MIRPATIEDLQPIVEMGRLMHAESPHFCRLRYSPEKVRLMLEHLVHSEDGFLWVAELAGQRVGMMLAMAPEHWCSTDHVAIELALYIAPAHRGSNCAFRLVRRFLEWKAERGAVFAQAGVSTGLFVEKSAQLYEAAGMRRFGVLLEA